MEILCDGGMDILSLMIESSFEIWRTISLCVFIYHGNFLQQIMCLPYAYVSELIY